jgi:hypothetical protein
VDAALLSPQYDTRMDPLVEAALRKWPHVPHCYGWLALDARGDWYMRDERTQAAGPFAQVKGSRIVHDKLLAFIHRNYLLDERGAAYFQNGPQRVYVQLEAAPYIWRLHGDHRVMSHTGQPADVEGAWVDEHGRLFLQAMLGAQRAFGIVHSLDMDAAADALEQGLWHLSECPFAQMPQRFGYVLDPHPPTQGHPAPQAP